jgi:uncharacterized cysteine cluster protein YcgN (CxxCxxCC family)
MTTQPRKRFWELPLAKLRPDEWESLCDGCGKCCLNKLEDEETGEVAFTRVSCRLLDGDTCRCAQYDIRLQFVPECIVLNKESIAKVAYFMPSTCAYRLRHEGKPLPDWHPLITGDPASVHDGHSVRGWTVPEFEVDEDDWEDHVIEDQ